MRINKNILGKIALGMIAATVIIAASLFNVIMVTSPPTGPPADEPTNGTIPDPKIAPIRTDLEMTASSQLIACNYQNGVIIEAI